MYLTWERVQPGRRLLLNDVREPTGPSKWTFSPGSYTLPPVQSDKTSKPKKATINWLQKFFYNQGQEREARDALIASKFYDQAIPSSTVSAEMEKA